MAKRIPPDPPGGDPNEDTLDLLSLALYLRENHKEEIESAGVASKADGDYRARASARLYDFSARYFSDRIESIKRDAVIAHLATEHRRGPRFTRLVLAAAAGMILTQVAVALWRDPAPLRALADGGARNARDISGPK